MTANKGQQEVKKGGRLTAAGRYLFDMVEAGGRQVSFAVLMEARQDGHQLLDLGHVAAGSEGEMLEGVKD